MMKLRQRRVSLFLGQCGACWAFSTVANLEYWYMRNNRQNLDFSEQALLDCDTQSQGCNGGYPNSAFNGQLVAAIIKVKYTECKFLLPAVAMKERQWRILKICWTILRLFIVAVLVTHAMQYFKGGLVYRPTQAECASNVGGHAWLIAGLDYEGNNPYYIIKNSWGTS
ncbi:unnamed protein product [Gongylonema pulchrum]|uniref:Pept_C1 domain-containing protein n=1 Tax=Gongylonema pulchrum TaxID=637853 RepID=A0A183DZV2_9BILA|nr:unnamed protein product [Gongylonema pulchrum]